MSKRFKVALSYAGEKRDFVSQVATILAQRFGEERILYDKYHAAEFARGDLGMHLPALYHDDADLVVAVLCKDYASKQWCGLEWNAIFGLLKKREFGGVMLSRFDLVEVKELFGLAGFLDLDHITPSQAVIHILERLALNEGLPMNHYHDATPSTLPEGPDWPEVAPKLDWSLADHRDAQRAFSQLITRAAPFRILCVHGESDTGKTHLTKQFLRHGLGIQGLTCGRFDFKGSADMEAELRRFAEHLDVATPATGASASGQLAQIVAALRVRAKPTLLIFDTFEEAGDAERWMKESLLLAAVRYAWLRVIVVGRRPTKAHGEAWEGVGSPSIELRPPKAEDWFEYCRGHKPEITIDEVRTAHKLTKGRVALLAQLLGPDA